MSSLLYQVAGWALVGVATLGLFLPLLPTTPFLLVASMCFVRSSPRAQRWLLNSRWFGPLLRDWNEHRAVRKPVKYLAVAVVSGVIALSFWRDVHWVVRTLIVVLGLVGLTVIYLLPTVPKGRATREAADG
jgi:uncharacterized membrane protein YbaN (DUF454 family)